MSAYLDRENPTVVGPCATTLTRLPLSNMQDPLTGELYLLNLETVQTLWFYNKQAFADAGYPRRC